MPIFAPPRRGGPAAHRLGREAGGHRRSGHPSPGQRGVDMATRKKAAGARPASTQLMREALLRSLQREEGKVLKGRQRLQLAADALVDAAIEGEMAALRELLQRSRRQALRRPERRGGEATGRAGDPMAEESGRGYQSEETTNRDAQNPQSPSSLLPASRLRALSCAGAALGDHGLPPPGGQDRGHDQRSDPPHAPLQAQESARGLYRAAAQAGQGCGLGLPQGLSG